MTTKRIRYCVVVDEVTGEKRRRRVVMNRGFEGYVVRWTQGCSGCSYDDGSQGGGCHECGYTGKVRERWWAALDEAAFQQYLDARWARRERLVEYFRRKRAA